MKSVKNWKKIGKNIQKKKMKKPGYLIYGRQKNLSVLNSSVFLAFPALFSTGNDKKTKLFKID